MSGETNPMDVLVSIGSVMDDHTMSYTGVKAATLYDEASSKAYKRCVEVPGLEDPSGAKTPSGTTKLRQWVKDCAEMVVLYSDNPGSLDIGGSGLVGLTGRDGTETKVVRAFVDTSLPQITVQDVLNKLSK